MQIIEHSTETYICVLYFKTDKCIHTNQATNSLGSVSTETVFQGETSEDSICWRSCFKARSVSSLPCCSYSSLVKNLISCFGFLEIKVIRLLKS